MTTNSTEATVADFKPGDRVQHVFFGTYATVAKVGRRLLTVDADVFSGHGRQWHHSTQRVTWLPTSVRKVDA